MISFVQKIIDFLVDLAVGAIKFLFYIWDDLVKPTLGSVMILIKEVVQFTVKLILSIMTKALTTDNPYKNYVEIEIRNIIENTNWSVASQHLQTQFSDISLQEVVDPLASDTTVILGPTDSISQIFDFIGIINLPGIIKELLNLIGPQLTFTLVSELLSVTFTLVSELLSVTFTLVSELLSVTFIALLASLIQSFGISNIITFLNSLKLQSLISGIINDILDFVENSIEDVFSDIHTFSGFISKFGELAGDIITNFSMWGYLLNHIMSNLKTLVTGATDPIFEAFMDIISLFIGGILYILSPTFVSKMIDIGLFLGLSLFSQILSSMIELKDNLTELQVLLLSLFSHIISTVNWYYVMAYKFFGVKWGILYKYGPRFGYLGSNVLSFMIDRASGLLDSLLPWNIIKNWIINDLKVPDVVYNIAHAYIAHFFTLVAAIITSGLTIESFLQHFNEKDGVFFGDLSFLLQAGIIHFVLNLNKMIVRLKGGNNPVEPLDWLWNFLGLTTKTKRQLAIFSVNFGLDVIMSIVFISNTP